MDASRELIGDSPELQALLRQANLVARTDATVLIQGESGTGKERLARRIHAHSRRNAAPLITVNCAALPADLIESELFGHRRGAFTGAHEAQQGLIRQADGGTLLLDEIAELPPGAQAKLLRFLESGECQPLGAARPEKVDVRVIAATHQDLNQHVAERRFRADLFYRLFVVPLEMPPLRQRQGDVRRLVEHFRKELASAHGLEPPHFSPELVRWLERWPWPGNVRELKNLVERCVIFMSAQTVRPQDLPDAWLQSPRDERQGSWVIPPDGLCLERLEIDLIRQALERTGGNRSRAARLLGLTRNTLLYRIKKSAISWGHTDHGERQNVVESRQASEHKE
ncbi:sigma-54-dependent Fis family transcriptional regulator [Thioalkalivibrio sp. ALJ7]|uniref:sigma-54 interaction domain-containing protein n=1 Tax=Thioalkalivibrio sp. ALJ7 TaxID=1158756 RepID=UPI00036E9E3E|nr:sigma-54 dependent transcriptional regulator [Thioalkalivibrio sp. ALJ7]